MEAKRILIKSEIIIEEIELCFVSGKDEIVITIEKNRFANNEEYITTLKDLFKCKIPFMQDDENIYLYIKPEELTSISF